MPLSTWNRDSAAKACPHGDFGQRNWFTNEQIPVNDLQHIVAKQQARQTKHPFNEVAKDGCRAQAPETWGLWCLAEIDHALVTAILLLASIEVLWLLTQD